MVVGDSEHDKSLPTAEPRSLTAEKVRRMRG